MTEEDKDLEMLKAKRLAEMQKNISSQQKQEDSNVPQGEQKKNEPTPREIVVQQLGYRGLEVLGNAEYQFPKETQIIILKLAELISSGSVTETLEGGKLLALFRGVGINVRMKNKINVEKDGKFVSLSDKLRIKESSVKDDQMPTFEISTTTFDEDISVIQVALTKIAAICDLEQEFKIAEPLSRFGWTFFQILIKQELYYEISDKL